MAIEVERKFIVPLLPDGIDVHPHAPLQQCYLAIAADGGEVRIRRRNDACMLTVKQGRGLARREEEVAITTEIFDSLWSATEGRRIEKVRHFIPAGDLMIELDRYTGMLSGLHVAEIEFHSEESAKAWTPPHWFGPEVTENLAYKNQQLALHGWPAS